MDINHTGAPRSPRPVSGRALALPAMLAGLVLTVASCQRAPDTAPAPQVEAEPPLLAGPVFRDVTADSGVNFTYRNGEEAEHLAILESLGGGLAVLDYDGDGLLDLFIAGGGYYDRTEKEYLADKKVPGILGHPCKLYKNLGNFRFKDVTAEMGLSGPWFYSHGVAVADYDLDGWPDVLLTGWGKVALFHNEKGRKFVEVKNAALNEGWSSDEIRWSSSAGWADLDGDGYPDLYVCQYADWSFEKNHPRDCTYDGHKRDVCPPRKFAGIPHKLFRNNRDGTFTEIGKAAGLRVPRTPAEYNQLTWLDKAARERLQRSVTEGDTRLGKGLGVVIADLNGDGLPDIYVANDTVDNFLYLNRRDRKTTGQFRFEERGLETGTARDGSGAAQGSMGIDVGDPYGTGRPDIWVTNYENELHALYRNECKGKVEFFLFASQPAGIGAIGQNAVAWGTGFLDVDHHGWEDIFFTAGHAIRYPTRVPRAQRPVLFRNVGRVEAGKFKDASRSGGPYFEANHVGRGVVLADFDNDGRIDLAICHLNEPVAILRNEAQTGDNHWLGLELAGKTLDGSSHRRDVVGARIVVESGGRKQSRFAKGGGSYCSSGDRRHVVGLGPVGQVDRVSVYWPDGGEQHWQGADLAVDRYWRLTEGTARAEEIKYPGKVTR
jgi:hypothetical protein